jgi:hypothetical protein
MQQQQQQQQLPVVVGPAFADMWRGFCHAVRPASMTRCVLRHSMVCCCECGASYTCDGLTGVQAAMMCTLFFDIYL